MGNRVYDLRVINGCFVRLDGYERYLNRHSYNGDTGIEVLYFNHDKKYYIQKDKDNNFTLLNGHDKFNLKGNFKIELIDGYPKEVLIK